MKGLYFISWLSPLAELTSLRFRRFPLRDDVVKLIPPLPAE